MSVAGRLLSGRAGGTRRPAGRARARIVKRAVAFGKAEAEARARQGEEDVPYAFKKQWYPLVVVDMLDEKKPHPVSLLGERLVVWKDGQGEWRVFEDRCPHRAAPLSEGRVEEDGTLMCAYHAWRFDSEGNCAAIPQAADPETQQRIVGNPRACATKRPSFVSQGLVWAWGESGPDALMESMAVEPSVVPEMLGTGPSGPAPGETDAETGDAVPWNGGAYRNSWQCRDLPYGWAAFFENAIDPAHAVVSHHAVVGDRYDDPAHFECVTQRNMTREEGFRCEVVPAVPPFNMPGDYDDARVWYDFRPPCNLLIDWRHAEGSRLLTAHYAVPTKPGWIRHIVATVAQRGGGDAVLSHRWWKLNLFTLTSPAWMTHVVGPTFLHQDMVLLHQQEKIVLEGGHGNVSADALALPAEANLPQLWKDIVSFLDCSSKAATFSSERPRCSSDCSVIIASMRFRRLGLIADFAARSTVSLSILSLASASCDVSCAISASALLGELLLGEIFDIPRATRFVIVE